VGINALGKIAGYYFDSADVAHGFIREPNKTITTFDPPGSISTVVFNIGASGEIVGTYEDSAHHVYGFLRSASGVITAPVEPVGSSGSGAAGISSKNAVVGSSNLGTLHGFERTVTGKYTTFDPTGSIETFAYGINTAGVIAGYYVVSGGVNHGFMRAADKTITPFDPAGSVDTTVLSINTTGVITGYYKDSGGLNHGFVLTP
jgi:hypothetical protein